MKSIKKSKHKSNNQRGGKRPGSGRKPGATQVRTAEVANILASDDGILPLEVMIQTMRARWNKPDRTELDEMAACAIAEKAAPYMHPKLASVETKGSLDVTGAVTFTTIYAAKGS